MNPSPPYCYRCRRELARSGRTRCVECARLDVMSQRAYQLKRFAALLAVDPSAGVRKIALPCADCRVVRAAGRRRCTAHLAADVVTLKARRAKARAEHRCYYCKLPPRAGLTTCAAHAGSGRRRQLT